MTPSTDFAQLIIVDTTGVEMVDHTRTAQEKVEYEIPQEDPIISLHALASIPTPQSLNL